MKIIILWNSIQKGVHFGNADVEGFVFVFAASEGTFGHVVKFLELVTCCVSLVPCLLVFEDEFAFVLHIFVQDLLIPLDFWNTLDLSFLG